MEESTIARTANTPIDEGFAKQFFGNQDPIGKHINLAILNESAGIVGIVGHENQWGLDSDSSNSIQAQCFLSLEQMPDSLISAFDRGASGVVRTGYAQTDVAASLSRAMQTVSSDSVVYDVESMTVTTGAPAVSDCVRNRPRFRGTFITFR
jgi:hypothetical protein